MKKMNLILSGSLLVMSLGVLSPAVVYAGAETETAQEDENAKKNGYRTMRDSCRDLVLRGITTAEEAARTINSTLDE